MGINQTLIEQYNEVTIQRFQNGVHDTYYHYLVLMTVFVLIPSGKNKKNVLGIEGSTTHKCIDELSLWIGYKIIQWDVLLYAGDWGNLFPQFGFGELYSTLKDKMFMRSLWDFLIDQKVPIQKFESSMAKNVLFIPYIFRRGDMPPRW